MDASLYLNLKFDVFPVTQKRKHDLHQKEIVSILVVLNSEKQ